MRISGIGPKTARRFWTDLGVDGPATLVAAIDAGRLEGLSGFGPKKIAKVREALAAAPSDSRRRPLREAARVAQAIVTHIRTVRRSTRLRSPAVSDDGARPSATSTSS